MVNVINKAVDNGNVYHKKITDEQLLNYFKPLRNDIIDKIMNFDKAYVDENKIRGERGDFLARFNNAFLDRVKSFEFGLAESKFDLSTLVDNKSFKNILFADFNQAISDSNVLQHLKFKPAISLNENGEIAVSQANNDALRQKVNEFRGVIAKGESLTFIGSGKLTLEDHYPANNGPVEPRTLMIAASGKAVEVNINSSNPEKMTLYSADTLSFNNDPDRVATKFNDVTIHTKGNIDSNLTPNRKSELYKDAGAKFVNSEVHLHSKNSKVSINAESASFFSDKGSTVEFLNSTVEKSAERKSSLGKVGLNNSAFSKAQIECTSLTLSGSALVDSAVKADKKIDVLPGARGGIIEDSRVANCLISAQVLKLPKDSNHIFERNNNMHHAKIERHSIPETVVRATEVRQVGGNSQVNLRG